VGGHDQSYLFRGRSREVPIVTDFFAQIDENLHTPSPPSLCALAPPCADGTSMSDKNLMNFGPVTYRFCRGVCAKLAHAGLCHASS